MNNDYRLILSKLDVFIRKYYKNQALRGGLLSATIIISAFIFAVVSEYFGNFSIPVRTIIFYSLLAGFIFVISKFIVIPLLRLFKIGKTISHYQAAKIISRHFGDLQDKLINTLELNELQEKSPYSQELVLASIQSRIEKIKPIPFQTAIKYKDSLSFLKYLFAAILLTFLIYFFNPRVINVGSNRIINYSEFFAPEAPFRLVILNDSLKARKGNDFTVKIKTEGRVRPENVAINYSGNSLNMIKDSKTEFEYTFKNLNSSLSFYLTSGDITSESYKIEVLPSPAIMDFTVTVDVPEYTGETDRILNNTGDITVPLGSVVKWDFKTSDINSLSFIFNDSLKLDAEKTDKLFSVKKKMLETSDYRIIATNNFFSNEEIMKYFVKVTPDLYPSVKAMSVQDSVKRNVFYFKGIITDDYGFTNLYFIYKYKNSDRLNKFPVQISKNNNSQEFYYSFDFSTVDASSQNNLEYYFEVFDNDQINGAKSSKSTIFEYSVPTREDLIQQKDEASNSLQSKISESQSVANELKNQINQLQEDMVNKNLTEWERNKKIDDILNKQDYLQKLMFQLQQENAEKNELQNSISEEQQEMLDKQNQIRDLLEKLMDDDLKKLLEEFNELKADFDKEKLQELSEKMKMSYDDLKKQLDKDLELLKKYDLEQKIQEKADELEKLAEKQDSLSKQSEDKKADSEKLSEKQQEQKDEMNKIEQDYKELLEKNKELTNPEDLKDFNKEFDDIKNEMNEGEQNLQKKNNSKASKNQKSASQKMKDLASSMQKMMQQNEMQQNQMNMDDLRQIIDNLVNFSFNQEDLMTRLKDMNIRDPKMNEINKEQLKLADDFTTIKDSLTALSRKTPQISSAIDKEVKSINQNLKQINTDFEDKKVNNVRNNQQFVMTSANNLALLLSEILKMMQNQMQQQQMQGNKQCNNPSDKSKPFQGLKQQQQNLKGQLEKMIEQMKNSKDKGNNQDPKAQNKEISKTLAQQEIFNKMLNDLKQNQTLSPDAVKKLNEISQLNEQNQKDLVNKNITPDLLKRQNQILTRLLEAEKSDIEREVDKKRESKEVKNDFFGNPEEIFKYKGLNSQFNDLINLSNIELNKYYSEKYKEYLLKLQNNEK